MLERHLNYHQILKNKPNNNYKWEYKSIYSKSICKYLNNLTSTIIMLDNLIYNSILKTSIIIFKISSMCLINIIKILELKENEYTKISTMNIHWL